MEGLQSPAPYDCPTVTPNQKSKQKGYYSWIYTLPLAHWSNFNLIPITSWCHKCQSIYRGQCELISYIKLLTKLSFFFLGLPSSTLEDAFQSAWKLFFKLCWTFALLSALLEFDQVSSESKHKISKLSKQGSKCPYY